MVTWGHRIGAINASIRVIEEYMARVDQRESAEFSMCAKWGIFRGVWEVLDGDHRVDPVGKQIKQSKIINDDTFTGAAKSGCYKLETPEGLLMAVAHVFMVAFQLRG